MTRYTVQSIVIPKTTFNKRDSIKWVIKHGYITDYGVDIKKNVFRIRQNLPSKFIKESYRTIVLPNGVELVIGILI